MNLVAQILENNRKKAIIKDFGLIQLTRIDELTGRTMTSAVWDLLLFNIHTLYIEDGFLKYTSHVKTPSKKVNAFLEKNKNVIIENFELINKEG